MTGMSDTREAQWTFPTSQQVAKKHRSIHLLFPDTFHASLSKENQSTIHMGRTDMTVAMDSQMLTMKWIYMNKERMKL